MKPWIAWTLGAAAMLMVHDSRAEAQDATAGDARVATIDDLAWIAGDRESRGDASVARETWIGPAGGVLLGMSLTSRAGKPAQYEHLRIAADGDGTLAYFSIPSGQSPTTFRLKSIAPGLVVFENAAHDFPQRIIYRDLGDGRVAARIEGEIGGREREVDWTFEPTGR